MPEKLTHLHEVHACRQVQHRCRVPKVMQANAYLSERTAILRRKVVNPDTDERAFPRLSEEGTGISWWRWYLDAAHALSEIGFRGNRYRDLAANIFIGTEKAGILTQLEQWFGEPYHIPIYPLGGNGSQTKIDELIDYAVQARDVYERPNYFIYAGDFDAKGFDIERDFTDRVSRAFEPEHIIRVGMTLDQVRANPQWRLRGKPKDTSAGAFFDRFGDDAYYDEENDGRVAGGRYQEGRERRAAPTVHVQLQAHRRRRRPGPGGACDVAPRPQPNQSTTGRHQQFLDHDHRRTPLKAG